MDGRVCAMQAGQSSPAEGHRAYCFGPFALDLERKGLFRGTEQIPLRPKSFDVLLHLAMHHGTLVSRDALLKSVWGKAIVGDGSLTQCLIEVRRAIGDHDRTMIRTIPRRGFVMELPVTLRESGRMPGDPTLSNERHMPAATGRQSAAGSVSRRRVAFFVALLLATVLIGMQVTESLFDKASKNPAATPGYGVQKSIAVLPFVDMSAQNDQAWFGDGVAEEIINLLAQSGDLQVIARTSSFAFRDRPGADIATIGDALRVTHVLEGSVRKDRDIVRITAQLVDVRNNAHVWSQTFDRNLADVLAVQDEIAISVAEALSVALPSTARKRSARTVDLKSRERYLQGRFLYNRRKPGDMERARLYFEEAVELDPHHGAAWAALAGAYTVLWSDDVLTEDAALALMGVAVEQALISAPELPDTHLRAARYYYWSGQTELARLHYDKVRELGGNSPLILVQTAASLAQRLELEEAIALQRRAIALDPISSTYRIALVQYLLADGSYEEALVEIGEAEDLNPGTPITGSLRAQTYVLLRRHEDALATLVSLPATDEHYAYEAMALLEAGRYGDAALAAQRLANRNEFSAAAARAMLHAFQGEREQALGALEQLSRICEAGYDPACHFGRGEINTMRISPFFRPLHDDARWKAWLASTDRSH